MKILFIGNQLSYTGAPLLLLDTCRICLKNGITVDLISMNDGPLRKEFEKLYINIEIWDSFIKNIDKFNEKLAREGYALVFVNTIIPFEVIHILKNRSTPVIWWIHEGDEYFDVLDKVLPDFKTLPSNITLLSVSPFVRRVIFARYGVDTDILMLMVSELKNSNKEVSDNQVKNIKSSARKIRFLTVGAFSQVKGQDILLKAIQILPENIRNRSFFTFIGRENENTDTRELFDKIKSDFACVEEKFANGREEIISAIETVEYVIVPSRWETVSMVGVEALMVGKPIIITDTCGATEYLENMEDSFIIKPEETSLQKAIVKAVDIYNTDKYNNMCRKAREIYLRTFSVERFERELLNIISKKVIKEKLVSVIIPCHNVAKWLPQCFLSLVRQSIGIENIELIFVDDASTDNGATLSLLMEMEKAYSENIMIIALKENLRQGGARNVGLEYATGKYIAFVDSDDFVEENFLKEVVDIAEGNKADIIQFEFYHCTESGKVLEDKGTVENNLEVISINTSADRKKFLISEKLNYGCCNKLYRRELVQKTGVKFAEKVIYEEPLFVYPLFFEFKKAIRTKKAYYYYRQNNSGTMHSDMEEKNTVFQHSLVQLMTLEFMKNSHNFKEFREEIKLYFLHTYLYETLLFAKRRGIKINFYEFEPLIKRAFSEFKDINVSIYEKIIPKQMSLYKLVSDGITFEDFENYWEKL